MQPICLRSSSGGEYIFRITIGCPSTYKIAFLPIFPGKACIWGRKIIEKNVMKRLRHILLRWPSINEKRDSIKILTWDPRYFPFRNRCFQISSKGNFTTRKRPKNDCPTKKPWIFFNQSCWWYVATYFFIHQNSQKSESWWTHVKNWTVIKWFLYIHLDQVSCASHFELVRLTPRAKPDTSLDPVRTCTHSRESCEKCSIII